MATNKAPVFNYFVRFKEGDQDGYKCIVKRGEVECGTVVSLHVSGGQSFNLKRHLRKHHDDEHKCVLDKEEEVVRKKAKGQMSLDNFMVNKKTGTSKVTKEELELGILKMVAYDGVALRFFEGDGFRMLNGKAAAELNVSLGRGAVRDLVLKKSEEERVKLKEKIKDVFVYLKFDGVTRLRNHYLGITLQFFDEKEGVQVRTLGLVDTQACHGSTEMKQLLLGVTSEFAIQKSHVLGCVVDNASNMTKTIQLLNEDNSDDE